MSANISEYNYVNFHVTNKSFTRTPEEKRPFFLFSASQTLQKIHFIASHITKLEYEQDSSSFFDPPLFLNNLKNEAQKIFDNYKSKKANANLFQKLLLKMDTFIFNRLLGVATYEQHLSALNKKIQNIDISSI